MLVTVCVIMYVGLLCVWSCMCDTVCVLKYGCLLSVCLLYVVTVCQFNVLLV